MSSRFHSSAWRGSGVPASTIGDEPAFHNIADASLAHLETSLQTLEDAVDGFDLSVSMGVLTLKLGDKGTYVINKQTPNRQLWWSSPVSGPRRYHFVGNGDGSEGSWINTRDGHDMLQCLASELKKLTGHDVPL